MSHHSEKPFGDFGNADEFRKQMQEPQVRKINELMADAMQTRNLGATGRFPNGKLTNTDEGEIKIGIAEVDGRVVMNFGKPIEWIGFEKEQAKQIAFSLQHKAGFSMWQWMKSWLYAYEREHPDKISANEVIMWMQTQPTTAG